MIEFERSKELIVANILEGLNQAAGAAGTLIHHQQNTHWMRVRRILEAVREQIVNYSVEPMLKPKPKNQEFLNVH